MTQEEIYNYVAQESLYRACNEYPTLVLALNEQNGFDWLKTQFKLKAITLHRANPIEIRAQSIIDLKSVVDFADLEKAVSWYAQLCADEGDADGSW